MQMKRKYIFMLLLGLGVLFRMNSACANLYTVAGVPVVAERSSVSEAKEVALLEGEVEAFNRLMARLAPDKLSELPHVTEESVLPYVLGVSIEEEKTTATKYMGKISVEFDPTAVRELLNAEQVTYLKTQAPSLLVIPEYASDGQAFVLEDANPLYAALKEKKDFAPFYQAIVPQGTEEERNLVRQGTDQVGELLETYKKERIMFLRLKHEEGDMWQISSDFYPANYMENQRVTKRFRFASGSSKAAALQMAEAVFSEMEARWRADRTSSLNTQNSLYLRVIVNSLQEWLALEKEMKNWSFLESISLRGVYLPRVLVEVSYKTTEGEVAERLKNLGWQLDKDLIGNGATLKRGNIYE